jgi:hypothetical protein
MKRRIATEAQIDIAGQLFATWVSQQMRQRDILARPFGRFTLSNGLPILVHAEYHRPDDVRPRLIPADCS